MPRPQKKRSICQMPSHDSYGPLKKGEKPTETVILSVDELECIRLIDYENLTQEEAASQMLVARTTVQRIYNDARKKIADSIINGKQLKITGGEYILCDRDCENCKRPGRLGKHYRQILDQEESL